MFFTNAECRFSHYFISTDDVHFFVKHTHVKGYKFIVDVEMEFYWKTVHV